MKNHLLSFTTLLLSTAAFSQNHLIAFTKTKGNGGCNDMNYQKILLKDKDDYYKQSTALSKQAAASNQSYKDYYVSAQDFAIVVEYTGQHYDGSCTFRKYEFARGKKSLEEARAFIQKQSTNFKGLYASAPQEVSVFGTISGTTEVSKSEKQLGDLHAKFYTADKNTKKQIVAQLKNNNTTKNRNFRQ